MPKKLRKSFTTILLVSGLLATTTAAGSTGVYRSTDTPCERDSIGGISYYAENPSTANETRVIGRSSKGRPIIAEHWGPRNGPQILVIGQVHGDECSPAYLVRELRDNPITSKGLWLIPTLNPDGLMLFVRGDSNRRDLNRDGHTKLAPETRALLNFTAEVKPSLSLHLHSPYRWVGQYNGGAAAKLSAEIARRAGWGGALYAGGNLPNNKAFLWEGQHKVLPGHQSVLIEFPAISKREAPGAPRKDSIRYASVEEVVLIAKIIRNSLQRL